LNTNFESENKFSGTRYGAQKNSFANFAKEAEKMKAQAGPMMAGFGGLFSKVMTEGSHNCSREGVCCPWDSGGDAL